MIAAGRQEAHGEIDREIVREITSCTVGRVGQLVSRDRRADIEYYRDLGLRVD